MLFYYEFDQMESVHALMNGDITTKNQKAFVGYGGQIQFALGYSTLLFLSILEPLTVVHFLELFGLHTLATPSKGFLLS